MSLIKDVKTILENNGFNEQIYFSYAPDDDYTIALYATGGYPPTDEYTEQPTFQVFIRDTDYEHAYTLFEQIKDILKNSKGVIIENNKYLSFYMQSDIIELGADEKNRRNFTINYRCYVNRNYNKV